MVQTTYWFNISIYETKEHCKNVQRGLLLKFLIHFLGLVLAAPQILQQFVWNGTILQRNHKMIHFSTEEPPGATINMTRRTSFAACLSLHMHVSTMKTQYMTASMVWPALLSTLTTCYFGIRVLSKVCIQHGITDLVTNLICGVTSIFQQ